VLPERPARLAPSARWMASVCSGGLLLAAAGLLTGRHATTNRNAYEELRGYQFEVLDERVVDDGDRITAGALTAEPDLGLWITARELGTAVADRVARSIEYIPQGRVWRSPRSAP
jgi:transcriptional regulator GlxA family with amidase domain